MPLTIWRYTLADLWRLILLTAGVLSSVIVFAAMVRPLAAGTLGPLEALKFMLIAIPPMLQYALPFAAGFGATLTYFRLTQDREVLAAHAGGISHGSVLFPAVLSGMVLAGGLSLLSEEVIPRFVQRMEAMIRRDLTRIMVNSIDSGRSVRFGPITIHAQNVKALGPDPARGAYESLVLSKVGAVELDRDGSVHSEATAARAWVWFVSGKAELSGGGEGEDITSIVILLERPVIRTPDGLAALEQQTLRWSTANLAKDDPKFLTWRELRALRADPEQMNWVDLRRRDLAHYLGERELTDSIRGSLQAERRVTLRGDYDRSYIIRASDMAWNGKRWELSPPAPGEPIEVERISGEADGGGVRRFRARTGGLITFIGTDMTEREMSLRLQLEDVSSDIVSDGGAGGRPVSGEVAEQEFGPLNPVESPLPALLVLDSQELLARAQKRLARTGPDTFIGDPARLLRTDLAGLSREITGNQQMRLAMSASCFVMLVTGAVSAMRLGSATPLAAYLWSFFPALGTVIAILAGQRVVHKSSVPIGLAMLWSAVGGLLLYTVWSFTRLRRH